MNVQPPSSWILDRPVIGGSITLPEGVTTIGRSAACSIVVTSDYVSRIHAEFQVQPESEEIQIRDLGSTNGVFVNGEVYNRAVCRLKAGDRIGIGVSVDNNQISADGKYPMYELRRREAVNQNVNVFIEEVVEESIQLFDQGQNDSDDCILLSSSDDEFDDNDDVDDFVAPQEILKLDGCIHLALPLVQPVQPAQSGRTAPPIQPAPALQPAPSIQPVSSVQPGPSSSVEIKVEHQVVENIQSIFGDLNQHIINNLPEKIQKIASDASVKIRVSRLDLDYDIVCISSDDDVPQPNQDISDSSVRTDTVQSFKNGDEIKRTTTTPTTTTSSKKIIPLGMATTTSTTTASSTSASKPETTATSISTTITTTKTSTIPTTTTSSIPKHTNDVVAASKDSNGIASKTSPKIDDADENEDEELYFTQQLFDDMKEELPDSENEMPGDYHVDEEGSLILSTVKQETCSQSLIDIDDDDYDENLETDVKNWSFKLFSKNTSNSLNYSQIYEDDFDSLSSDEKIDKDEETNCVESNQSKQPPTIDPNAVSVSEKDVVESVKESPFSKQWKRSTTKTRFFFSSSSSDDECHDEKAKQDLEIKKLSFSSSSSSSVIKEDKKPQSSDEIPRKKIRLGSTSERDSKNDKLYVNRKSSSTVKTYSKKDKILRKSSENDSQSSSPNHSPDKDTLDKLKKNDRASNKEHATKPRLKSTDSNSNLVKITHRSSLSTDDQSPFEVAEKDAFEPDKQPEKDPPTHKKINRGPPQIITPPQMPVNRGKLRGVSAVKKNDSESTKSIEKQQELKRKWKQKAPLARQKEKNKLNELKEERKQKLKELADKQLAEPMTKKSKSKSKQEDNNKQFVLKHTKCTIVSRGAFLTEEVPKKPYRIPKIKPKPTADATTPKSPPPTANGINAIARRFSDELLKADAIISNSHKPSVSSVCRERQKSLDVPIEQKQRAPARRLTNKLTFTAMEKHIKETSDAQQKLLRMSSVEKPIITIPKVKKTVRFNDTPQIFYIEPLPTTRPVTRKDISTFTERRHIIRRQFPLIDRTDELLSDVLSWSQIYLQNKKLGFNLDGLDELIYPMLNQFASIDAYRSIVFPLLKIEFLSHLESNLERYKSIFKIRVDYITPYKNRELLIAKSTEAINRSDLAMTDLVLIEIVVNDTERTHCFGFVGNMRKTNSCLSITIEILPNIIPHEIFKNAKSITVRRIIEAIRVYFGSFNAVHQLDSTPLLDMILNPEKIITTTPSRHNAIAYKGSDSLNEEQKDVLLRTYANSLRGFSPNVSLIKGPPGTGKSRLIVNLALQYLYGEEVRVLDKKILICAQSNMAVDVIAYQLNQIQKNFSPKFNVVRFGRVDKIDEKVRDITLSRIIERDHRARIEGKNRSPDEATTGENLSREIIILEGKIAELQRQNPQDVRKDELIEMQKDLALKRGIQNQRLSADDEKRLYPMYLGNANVVCTTLCSCVKLANFVDYFDICIIDEATQCIEPWTIMPLRFGVTSLIMVGDVQQLPATVISQKAKAYGLGISLFTRIQKCLESKVDENFRPIHSLNIQYRMHPEICKWPNMYFYQNQLQNAPNTSEFKSLIKPFSILNLEYRQNNDCHRGQISNSLEAEFVAKLVKALDSYIPNKFCSYGIITPYAQHREKLESMIRSNGVQNVLVNTIDSYQGIERDVIIISNARTQGIGFLANYQRLNVALTRPKKCLILCGNFKNLESVPSWASLLQNAKERGLYHDISTIDALDVERNVIEKIKIKRS